MKDSLPVSLLTINWAMTLLGFAFLIVSLRNTRTKCISIILEYLALVLLGLNAYLAFCGINDHADPISLAVIGLMLWFIKARNSNHANGNNK